MEEEDILSRWAEYIGDLFDDASDMLNFDGDKELSANEILESEVEAALNEMKSGKAPGIQLKESSAIGLVLTGESARGVYYHQIYSHSMLKKSCAK